MSQKLPPPRTKVGVFTAFIVVGMLALSYASVPLYRLFCQKTGFGGTPQIAIAPSVDSKKSNRKITVQFTADTHRDLPWTFQPLQLKTTVTLGEHGLAFYKARNNSSSPITGMATYNVSPDKAGIYFNKVACFCFEEQMLQPGQELEMPVSFFIDPKMEDDPHLKDVNTITLSYTFFKYK